MADLPVGDIIKDITDDVKLLVQDQIELAKAELIPAAKNGGTGAGLFGAAGYFAISATILLYFAAAWGRSSSGSGSVARVPDCRRRAAADRRHLGWASGICLSKESSPERTIAQANLATAEISDAAQRALAAANAPQIEGQVVPPTKAIT